MNATNQRPLGIPCKPRQLGFRAIAVNAASAAAGASPRPPARFRWHAAGLRCIWFCLIAGFALHAHAQGNLSITTSDQSPFRPASLSRSASIIETRRSAGNQFQIRVTVQYLMTDSETRRQIYSALNPDSIKRVSQVPPAPERTDLDATLQPESSVTTIIAPSRLTTYTLDSTEFAEVMSSAISSKQCEINVAPKIILLDGNEVEMTDLVQRPFVIGFHRENDQLEPQMHVLDEGTRLRMIAKLNRSTPDSPESIDLQCELTVSRVLDVQTDQLLGLGDEPLTIQVPMQRITSAVASDQLTVGETLLIDPHVTTSKYVENEQGIPILNKLPYVGRTFKNTGRALVQQHLMLLLQPSIEPISAP